MAMDLCCLERLVKSNKRSCRLNRADRGVVAVVGGGGAGADGMRHLLHQLFVCRLVCEEKSGKLFVLKRYLLLS